jgi:hypothetical protein
VSRLWHAARTNETTVWLFKGIFFLSRDINSIYRGTPHSTHNYVYCSGVNLYVLYYSVKFIFCGALSIATLLRHGVYYRQIGTKLPPWVNIWFFFRATKLSGDLIHLVQWVTAVKRPGFWAKNISLSIAEVKNTRSQSHTSSQHRALLSTLLI